MRSAAPLFAALLLGACGRQAQPLNLLLVSIDTCRADHLTPYGYERDTSPLLDELADEGVVFEAAFCQVPDTTPSHASLFTGALPDLHGAANGVPLGAELPTLAELLREQGYATAGFVSGSTMTAELSGLGRGFDTYNDRMTAIGSRGATRPNERPAQQTTARALGWLEQRSQAAPFFLFVHYFDPHALYAPPAPYDTLFSAGEATALDPADVPSYARLDGAPSFERYVDLYDGELRYVDDQLRRIVERLEQQGALDRTVIAVTSDHGEDMGEHGLYFSHGWRLYDPALRVPMIVRAPGLLPAGVRVGDPVQTVDLTATLLDLLGVEPPPHGAGESLVPLAHAPGTGSERRVLSRTTKTQTYLKLSRREDVRDFRSLRGADWKYLESLDGEVRALFALARDPAESRDVLGERREVVDDYAGDLGARVEALLRARAALGAGSEGQAPASEELLEELRGLGYVR